MPARRRLPELNFPDAISIFDEASGVAMGMIILLIVNDQERAGDRGLFALNS